MEDLRGLYSHIAGTVHRMAPFFIYLTQGINHRNNRDNGSRDSRFIKAGLNNLRRDERTNAIVHSDQTQTAILLPLPTPLRQKPIQPILNREEASISPFHDRMRDLAADFLAKHIPIRLMILRKHKDYTCGSIPTMKSL